MAALEDSAEAVWSTVREQAAEAKSSPVLAPYLERAIDAHATLPHAVAHMLAAKLASRDDGLVPAQLESELAALLAEPPVCAALTSDLVCVVASDPAAPSLLTVLLQFKGFAALQAHRAAHSLWARAEQQDDAGARQLALLLQGRASELLGVDIHPGAKLGPGIFIDHATGIVIGEQAEVGGGCYVLHGVTLGATGKKEKGTGRRHPRVGEKVTIGSGASILGPVIVGDGATVGANAVVTKNVEAGATVIDTSFMNNRVLAPRKAKAA